MKQFLFTVSVALLLASCCTTTGLHESGNYKIKDRVGNMTTFENVKGKYEVVSDTLATGKTIFINVIKAKHAGKGKQPVRF